LKASSGKFRFIITAFVVFVFLIFTKILYFGHPACRLINLFVSENYISIAHAKTPTANPKNSLRTMRTGLHDLYTSIVFEFSDKIIFENPKIQDKEIHFRLKNTTTKLRPFRKYKTFDSWVRLEKSGDDLNIQIGIPENFVKYQTLLLDNPHRLVVNLFEKNMLKTIRGRRHNDYASIVFQFLHKFQFQNPVIEDDEIRVKIQNISTKLRPFRKYMTFDSWVRLDKSGNDLDIRIGIPENFIFMSPFLLESPPRLVIKLYDKKSISTPKSREKPPTLETRPYPDTRQAPGKGKQKDIIHARITDRASTAEHASDNRDVLMKNALQLGWDENYEAAKAIYEQLLSNNPKDIEAYIGLATVTAWSGDHDKARQLYGKVLKQQSANRDALLGLGRVLFWQQEYKQSLETLDQLLAAYPGDQEAIKVRDDVLRAKAAKTNFKVRVGYQYQDISFTSNAHKANILISYNEPKKWAVRAGLNYIDKFGESASGCRVGGSYWATENTVLSFDMELAPEQDVDPRQAYTFEVSQAMFKTLVPFLSYRFADYSTADVHMVMPGFTWYFYPRFDWMVRYFLSISQFKGQESTDHSVMTQLNWNPFDTMTLFMGYARANESLESGNPVDPFAGFSANHVFVGFSWEFYKRVGLDFTFDYEDRDNGSTLNTYNTAIFYRW